VKLYDFYSRVEEDPDIHCRQVVLTDDKSLDHMILARKSTGRWLALTTRGVLRAEWADIVSDLDEGSGDPALVGAKVIRTHEGWSRSLMGELKQRSDVPYRVEQLVLAR